MNTRLLESKMKLFGDTQTDLAAVVGVAVSTFSLRLNAVNGCQFKQNDIKIIMKRYNLTPEEVVAIFFS